MKISAQLEPTEWSLVLKYLATAPINEAAEVFFKLKSQLEAQLQAQRDTTAAPAAPAGAPG